LVDLLSVLFSAHDLSESGGRDVFDALLLVYLVDRDPLVLERKQEEEELVFLVLVILHPLLVLLDLSLQLLVLQHQLLVSISVGSRDTIYLLVVRRSHLHLSILLLVVSSERLDHLLLRLNDVVLLLQVNLQLMVSGFQLLHLQLQGCLLLQVLVGPVGRLGGEYVID
jgi:hypothetical protein